VLDDDLAAAMSIDALNCGNTRSAAAMTLTRDEVHGQVPARRLDLLRILLAQLLRGR